MIYNIKLRIVQHSSEFCLFHCLRVFHIFTTDVRHVEESGSKSRTRSRRSPDKSSRSPLRNSTLDSNARKPSAVEFREPLVSYRLKLQIN